MHTALRTVVASLCLAAAAFAESPSTQPAAAPPARKLKVAIYADSGSPEGGMINVSKCLGKMPEGFDYKKVTAEDIRNGALEGCDVLVQPGGGGHAQADALQAGGLKTIQDFVKQGHGFVGICAGAYLATNDYPWSLGFINAKVVDKKHWARGPEAQVKMHFTDLGRQIYGEDADVKTVTYHQGPILAPSTQPDLMQYKELAVYDTEVVNPRGGIPGLMVGATAIAAGEYGQGHVIAIGPHPERSPGLDGVIRRSVQWAAGEGVPATQPTK